MSFHAYTSVVFLVLVACGGAHPRASLTRPVATCASAIDRLPHFTTMTGSVVGVLVGRDGCARAGTAIKLHSRHLWEPRVATSATAGGYAFGDLQPGEYVITVGDDLIAARAIVVHIGRATRLDLVWPVEGQAARYPRNAFNCGGGISDPRGDDSAKPTDIAP